MKSLYVLEAPIMLNAPWKQISHMGIFFYSLWFLIVTTGGQCKLIILFIPIQPLNSVKALKIVKLK